MSITTKQIAAQLGYSQQTVSDVLRRGPKYERYSEATRLRIEQAAAELGYRPNAAAQAMSSGRFNAIGLLMSRHRHQSTVYGELLRGVHDALEEQGIHLTVTFVDDVQLTADDSLPQVLRRAMVDGLLLNYTHGIPQRMSDLIDRHNLPAVWINSKQPFNCVYIDDQGGADEATTRLLQSGHRRVAYADLTAGLETAAEIHYSRADRLRGYQLAMRRAGLTPRVISPSVPLLNRRAVQFVCDQLQLPDRPTAIVCYGQNELQALVDAGYVLGIEVGRELKLSVFGEMPSPFAPEHEVVVLPEFSLGFTAARMLLNRVADPTRPQAPVAVPVRFTNPG